MTLLAFHAQKGLPPHHAPGQTPVQVLDGRALFSIAGKKITLEKGETLRSLRVSPMPSWRRNALKCF